MDCFYKSRTLALLTCYSGCPPESADADLGRFYANDPVGYVSQNPIQSFNRYAYGNGNPYKFVDPDGEFSIHVQIQAEGKLGGYVTTLLPNDTNASGGSIALGAAVSFPLFDDAKFDIGLTASTGLTDVNIEPNSSFISSPGAKVGAILGLGLGSVSDLKGQSGVIKGQMNIGKKLSYAIGGAISRRLPKGALKNFIDGPVLKAASAFGGFLGAIGLTTNGKSKVTGVEVGLAKGLNLGVGADVSNSGVCTLREGC